MNFIISHGALEGELFVNQFSKDKISNSEILNFMKKITAKLTQKLSLWDMNLDIWPL